MRSAFPVVLCAAWLAGCTMGPDYVRPDVALPADWRVSGEQFEALADTAWWQQFGDPVLDRLVAEALRENTDLRIASARVDEYAARLGMSAAEGLPQVGASANASRQQTSGAVAHGLRDTYNAFDASLNASWELDLWGRIRRENEAARAQLLASEEGRRGVVLSLTAGVASAYFTLRDLDRQRDIAVETVRTREAAWKVFEDRFAGGVVSLFELSQSQSQFEEARASVSVIERAIAQQEQALSLLLGRHPGPVERGRPLDELILPPIPAGLPASLLDRRPDIRQSEQNLVAANAMIGVAKAAYFPTLSLTGLTGSASAELSDLLSSGSSLWKGGATLSVPLFTGGRTAARVQVAEAQQQQALLAYRRTIQTALAEVNDALVEQVRTREQLDAQSRQVAALQVAVEMAWLRYDNGYTGYIEVLDAERSLFNAQLQQTQTQRALLQAMVKLYKAMGGGWQRAPGPDTE